MDFQALYKSKLTTAEEAVKVVKSGDWVDYTWCTNHPHDLDIALAAHKDELEDVKVRGGVTMWMPEICKADDAGEHFAWHSWHCSGIDRKIIGKGMGWFSPMRYSELPRFYRENLDPVDVVMFQAPPMDEHGNFNLSTAPSHAYDMCARAKCIIVEVNENMPFVYGLPKTEINLQDVAMVVEGSNPPLPELGSVPPTDVDRTVANLIVPEIPNGACLQLGIGGMPNTVGSLIAQSDLKDIGVNTEMFVDAFVDIAEAGIITGKCKNIDKNRQAFAFGAGTKKMYDFLDDNPQCMSVPVNYTNDIRTISALDNYVSINNCVDLDLYGQINSESAGFRQISGAGGQLDFVLGAYLSKGGKSFICCSSTMTDKKTGELKSRIVPTLSTGSIITDTRANIHYLVTEYGKVNLKGLSTWKKAEKIISVAHPKFRDELIKEAEKMKIWRRTNKLEP